MKDLIIVRGGGDLATGTIYKLRQMGFPVLVLEVAAPSAIRRTVSFSEAVYQGQQTVAGMTCHRASSLEEAATLVEQGQLAILVDPAADAIARLKPLAVVDAILAKKNLGTHKTMAPITVALGPGFLAGVDVDAVVETQRGQDLGKVICQGSAAANTGIPGIVGGYGKERVIYSPAEGILQGIRQIGDRVKRGEAIARVRTDEEEVPVYATLDGMIRGLIRDGYPVTQGFKIADIDPREESDCFAISDKSLRIADGVLEAVLTLKGERGL